MLEERRWQPDNSAAAAVYWLMKHQLDKCKALGVIALDPLLAIIQDATEDIVTLQNAVDVLGYIGDRRAIPALKNLYKKFKYPNSRGEKEVNLSHRIELVFVKLGEDDFILERMGPKSRWGKMLNTLGQLKPSLPEELDSTNKSKFTNPKEVVFNIQEEFKHYTRIIEEWENEFSINLEFDNYVFAETDGSVAPATRKLVVRVTTDGEIFYISYQGIFL